MERMRKDRIFSERVEGELRNKFFCFKGVKQYEHLKSTNPDSGSWFHFDRSESVSPPVNESLNNNYEQGIVFDSDCDESDNAKKGRDSLGATDLLAEDLLF